MTFSRINLIGLVLVTSLSLTHSSAASGQTRAADQDDPAGLKPKVLIPGEPGATLQSINEDYTRQLLQLERQRLDRLGKLAAHQPPNQAAETYEQLFRLAIANNLFRDAEPAAQQVLKSTQVQLPIVQFLARTVDIIGSADRGAYEESLAELRTLLATASKPDRPGEAASAAAGHPRPFGNLRGLSSTSPARGPIRGGAASISTVAQGIDKPRHQGLLRRPPCPTRYDR